MTRKYVKFDPNRNNVYCACGCGKILTKEQIQRNRQYATVECAMNARIGRSVNLWKVKRECLCGCGGFVSISNVRKGFPFIDKSHEDKYKELQREQELLDKKKNHQMEIQKYCTNFDETRLQCITCYEGGAAMYRGCYGKYEKPKS